MRFRLCLIATLLSCTISLAQDSLSRYAGLDSLLTEFYTVLARETVESKVAQFDALISTCTDSAMRSHVTLAVLDHYRHSRLMGEEGVAIGVYDKWIKSGRVKPRSEFEAAELELFANFNRHSLIGMTAPKVDLRRPHGHRLETIPSEGKVAVLFFFDTSCSKCNLESRVLPGVLGKVDFPMNFYAVYVGSDKKSWKRFRHNFKIPNQQITLHHLWDPEMDSGYQRLYGVVGTPRMFVVWKDGEILGRRLEVTNLQEIINYISLANAKEKE